MPKRRRDNDSIEHPRHYCMGGIEVLDFIEAWKLDFVVGNIVKYVVRSPYKGSELEDLRKAEFYLKRRISEVEQRLEKEAQAAPATTADEPPEI